VARPHAPLIHNSFPQTDNSSHELSVFSLRRSVHASRESQEVTISFYTDDLASFDNYGHGCYVLELGDYKFHVGATSYLAYAAEDTLDGLSQDDERYLYDDEYENHVIDYSKVYYVVVDEEGNALKDDDGHYQLTTEETSMRLDADCPILKEVGYDNEIWAYLTDELSLDDCITISGNMGWSTPAGRHVI